MFGEYWRYIKEYLALARPKHSFFALSFFTASLYKIFAIIRPLIAALIVKELTEQNSQSTYFYIFIYAIVYIAYRLTLFLNYKVYSWNVAYCYNVLQEQVFTKLLTIDSGFTRKVSKGRFMNTINSDLVDVGDINDEISEFCTTLFQIVIILLIVASYNFWSAIIMTVFATIYIIAKNYSDQKYNHYWWKSVTYNDQYSNFLSQVVSGLSEVKTFNMLPKLDVQLSSIQQRYDKSYKSQRKYLTMRANDLDIITYGFRSLLYIYLIFMIAHGNLTIDILILVISYHQYLTSFIRDFIDAATNIRLTNAAVKRLNSVLSYRPQQKIEFGNLEQDQIDGSIQFKNVSLTINRQTILKDINFKVKPHEFVAVVGYPGAGKTMLFNVLLRLMKPTRGQIYLDGININKFSRSVYASNVAVANQVPFIFNTSIRKNLDFVNTNHKQQIEACKTAGIHDFIEALPQGYNTILRENGSNVSGGQRQMISIARTILTNAEILLLDDITTSLDPDTAKLVPRLIKQLEKKHTVIMITKKPELMKLADRIIVLDRGKISDIGTHEKLLKRSRIYRSLQASQISANTDRREEHV